MKGSSKEFRIDIIYSSLNEMQQEKQNLEAKHREERAKVRILESKLETGILDYMAETSDTKTSRHYIKTPVSAKRNQANDKDSKMVETVNVAKKKVAQMEDQASRLTEIDDDKRKAIGVLAARIIQEQTKRHDNLDDLEIQLTDVAEKFRTGKINYTEPILQKEVNNWADMYMEICPGVQSKEVDIPDLSAQLQGMLLTDNDNSSKLEYKDVSKSELENTLLEFVEYKQKAITSCNEAIENVNQEVERFKEHSDEQVGNIDETPTHDCETESVSGSGFQMNFGLYRVPGLLNTRN